MKKNIRIIGIPMDLGQARRGVDMGPGAIRYAGLLERLEELGHEVEDFGNVQVPVRDSLPTESGEKLYAAIGEVCQEVYQIGRRSIEHEMTPLFLGGDHSTAIGTIGGISHHESVGVIWVDAHGDCNSPETSLSGNVHGMPLATLLGIGADQLVNVGRNGPKLAVDDVVVIGVRDLDRGEKQFLRDNGLAVYTMRDIDEQGMKEVAGQAIDKLQHRNKIHVSFDVDVLDPDEAPGVGTPVPGGLSYREAQLLMEILADTGKVASLDLVEINPIIDQQNKTARVAVALAASLFGQRII